MADRLAAKMINGKGCGRMLVIIMMTFYKQYHPARNAFCSCWDWTLTSIWTSTHCFSSTKVPDRDRTPGFREGPVPWRLTTSQDTIATCLVFAVSVAALCCG